MPTLLPTDINDSSIPALRLKNGGCHAIATSASSARNATGFSADTRIISLYATQDVYIKCGDSGVAATASDHFFPKNVYYDLCIGGGEVAHYTHIAALQVGAAGTLYISEKE